MKTIPCSVWALALLLHLPLAHAHGDAVPLHGGLVQTANDLQFELVNGSRDVRLYVVDHGKPRSVAGVSGKLLVLSQGKKSELALRPAEGQQFLSAAQPLQAGSKVVASLLMGAQQAITVRFVLK